MERPGPYLERLQCYPGANIYSIGLFLQEPANVTTVVDIYGGTATGGGINVQGDFPVTVHGTGFKVDNVPLNPVPSQIDLDGNVLGGEDGNGNPFSLLIYSKYPIFLDDISAGLVADADGENVTINSADQTATTINATTTGATTYRWLEGETVLLDWTPVGDGGIAPLDLGELAIPLGIGEHTLTLEATDGTNTVADTMTLTIVGAPDISSVVADVTDPVAEGTLVTLTTTFSGSTADAVVTWGDGTPNTELSGVCPWVV